MFAASSIVSTVDLATMIAALFIIQWPRVAVGGEMLY